MSDNATVVALKKQRSTVSRVMCSVAQEIVAWLELHNVTLPVRYISGKKKS